MTEFWVAGKNHYCSICNCWTKSTKRHIQVHEEGAQHTEKLKQYLKDKRQKVKDDEHAKEEIARIEKAAAKQMEKDKHLFADPTVAAGFTTGGSSSSQAVVSKPGVVSRPHERPKIEELEALEAKIRQKKEEMLNKISPDKKVVDEKPGKPLWKAVFDAASNRYYYWNRKTKASVWVLPPDYDGLLPEPLPVAKNAEVPVPVQAQVTEDSGKDKRKKPLWKECTEKETQRIYYYNRETKESVWEKPAGFDPVEPPPKKAKTEEAPKAKKSKRPVWRMVCEAKTKACHYVNRKTGQISKTRPPDFDGRELNEDGTVIKKDKPEVVEEPVVKKYDGAGGVVGMWEDVAVDETVFGGTSFERPDSEDGSQTEGIDPVPYDERDNEAAFLISKYRKKSDNLNGMVIAEDLVARDKEMVMKESMRTSADVTFKRKGTKRVQRRKNEDSDGS